MTTILRLVQGDSGTTLILNSSSTGFRLEEDGWNPVVASPVHMGDPPPVLERLDLLLINTSNDNIATNMQSLHEMQVLADRYINDLTQVDPVWLIAQMDGETGQRRSLVRGITVQEKPSWFGAGESTINIPLVLTVEREPYWESTTARDLPDYVRSSGQAAFSYDYTASGASVGAHDIVGDIGARIRFFDFVSPSDFIQHAWMGIRSVNKHGANSLSNFIDTWELEDGTNLDSEVSDSGDAGASGGNRVQVVPAGGGTDWDDGFFYSVCQIKLSTVTANEEDNLGNFSWLLRARCSASSSTWEVQAWFHYDTGSSIYNPVKSEIVEVNYNSASDYVIHELGLFPIGLRNYQTILESDIDFNHEAQFRITILARRTSGSSNLHLDCLNPIPVDEGFCYLDVPATGSFNQGFGISPKGDAVAVNYDPGVAIKTEGVIDPSNFILPPGDGRIFMVVAAPNKVNDLEAVTLNDGDIGKYYERWLSLRGSE